MRRFYIGVMVTGVVTLFTFGSALANHSWGGYHWAREANPVHLTIGDNVSGTWDAHLTQAISDWDNVPGGVSYPDVLDLQEVTGQAGNRNCRPDAGRIEVCSGSYGNNGWLGVAQIWVSSDHIDKASVRVNDFYFDLPTYDSPEWRQMVMCQEIGHTFGLDHQDENFNNQNRGTCMDYTSDPSTNTQPNAHDYEELAIIYSHLDTSGGGGGGPPPWAHGGNKGNAARDWGRLVSESADGGLARYELDLGAGQKLVTFVIRAR